MTLPRLHVVTDDAVLGRPHFVDRARSMIAAHGTALALHIRGHGTPCADIHRLAGALAGPAAGAGVLLLVNDRVDVALAAGCGVQIGRRSIPLTRARALLGPEPVIGYSAHDSAEAEAASADGADFILLGTIWPSRSHPERGGAGVALVRAVAAGSAVPVVAIGGVTPARAREALDAGAHGVAVLSGVWDGPDPVAAIGEYLEFMGAAR